MKKIDGRADESLRTFRSLGARSWRASKFVVITEAVLALMAIIGFASIAFSETDQTETLDYHVQN